MTEDIQDERPAKRFKYQSQQQEVKEVHPRTALRQSALDEDIAENSSHFYEGIQQWRELNLSPAFIKFADRTSSLSSTLPLLLHHWEQVVDLWIEIVQDADDEALKALLDLLQKLAHDLRMTLAIRSSDILVRLLALLPRSLSAAALTALLETFSALFKYVLIPSDSIQETVWPMFAEVLPKCSPDVQRIIAELWGNILRRLKAATREGCAVAIVKESNEDVGAWVLVTACKSVSQTLHTTTSSIFAPVIRHYLTCENASSVYTVLRRTMTALAHHCKTPEQYTPATNYVIEQLVSSDHTDLERTRRVLEILTIPCSVRQGSRMSQSQLSTLVSEFQNIPLNDVLHEASLKFVVACLTAGEMSVWLGPGRKALERAWERPVLGLELCGALSDLSWGGWKMLALPYIQKMTPSLLESDPAKTLELLSSLHSQGRLDGIEKSWKNKIQKWVDKWFGIWDASPQRMLELHHILVLSPLLSSLGVSLVRLTGSALETPQSLADFEGSCTNASWLLGACLRGLSRRDPKEWLDAADLPQWAVVVVQNWGWSGWCMEGLVDLLNAAPTQSWVIAVDDLYPTLQSSILSHSQALRLSVLRLLTCKAVRKPAGAVEVFNRLLQGEEVSLDVQGARERVLRITRLGQVLSSNDELGVDLTIRWLIAQLKVNLRPLWKPTAQALALLSQRFGDVTWKIVFNELREATESDTSFSQPSWMRELPDDDLDPISEEEKTWRDPSAHKLRLSTASWLRGNSASRAVIKDQIVGERFDGKTYEQQLLAALTECSALAEKHSRDLVPLFLSLAPPDDPTRLPKQKLGAWLEVFSKFTNPKALRSTEEIHKIYFALSSHPERSLQRLALSCILTYKSPHITPYQDKLELLLDDTRWRDELTTLNLSEIETADRSEFVNLLIRLLFGVMLEKRGRSHGADRRAAVLTVLNGCSDEELGLLVDLMLQPLGRGRDRYSGGEFTIAPLSSEVADKQLVGFLTLLEDVLKNIGTKLVKLWPALFGTLLDITASAQARIGGLKSLSQKEEEAEVADDAEAEIKESSPTRTLITIRQLGLKRLVEFFRSPAVFSFDPYMKAVFDAIISPRLATFALENTQAPSALMELFHVWSLRPEYTALLCTFDDRALPQVYNCLIATNVKEPVISKVFDIVDNVLQSSEGDEGLLSTVLRPHVSLLLTNLSILVERRKGLNTITDLIGRRQISILSRLAPWLADSTQASSLLSLFVPVLRKPTKLVPEKLKVDMVNIMESLFPLIPELSDVESPVFQKTYTLLSFLFQNLRSRPGRQALLASFRKLLSVHSSLGHLASLLGDLNAYSVRRIDEPDFDRRLRAFHELNEQSHATLTAREWLPVIYNMLHFIQDPDELTVRSSAALSIKRYVDLAASTDTSYEATFLKILYPGLKNGLRTKNELVRIEILAIISHAVEKCTRISSLQEMRVLLANGDEEANFFNNIHHVQVHRRLRALRRLAEYCDAGHLSSGTLTGVFIPLVSNFIQGSGNVDHHLVNEAILTTGRMAKQLIWGPYYALIQQYLRLSRQKDASERIYVRCMVSILDNFHFTMDSVVQGSESAEEPGDGELGEIEPEDHQDTLPSSTSQQSRIADVVNARLLPALLQHLEKRDETEDSLRLPVAVGIIQVALHLPQSVRDAQVSRLLTVLSQVFRSKSQETRDLARETLCKIAIILGPSYLHVVIRELRAALLRGPHLHVLAFTAHALLVHVTSTEHASRFHTLDDCVNDVAHVSAEVIFGESGKDVLADEFKTKMREVRTSGSKGFDSFSIIAKFITPPKISSLLVPIRNILHETETLRVMQQAEDLLRRIASGLNANEHLKIVDLLSLCHTLIGQNSRFLKENSTVKTKKGKKEKDDRLVQLKRKAAPEMDHFANNAFRFVAFGLELFNTAHKRSRFDFQDATVMARLEAMVPVIGNTLYSNHQQVIVPGMKAASAIAKCPLKSLEKSLAVFIRQFIDIIKQVGSTDSEAVQTAFKSLAAILRDQPKAQVKEKDLVYLLELLGPDLEEPARQQSVFSMLRAIVARKFIVPEIYDIMDKTSEIMVTNQSPQVQELARGVLLQFLLEYPQGKGRLRNHMTFFAKNLSYIHESGRRSVMELLNAVLLKFNPDLLREYSDLLFVALVMVVANDDSAKCRQMASEIIKGLFTRLEDGQRRVILSHVHSWAVQHTQPQLCRVSSQIYGIVTDLLQADVSQHSQLILDDLNAVLEVSSKSLEDASLDEGDEQLDVEWQIPYHAMLALTKLLEACPDLISGEERVQWPYVVSHLLFPHAWVRSASCRLLGALFTESPVVAPSVDMPEDSPLSRHGMEDIAKKLCLQLRSVNLDAALGLQIVKNMFYIGKCFEAFEAQDGSPDEGDESGDDETSDDEDSGEPTQSTNHPLSWLFSKLSFQAKSAYIARRNKSSSPEGWYHQPASVLRWFAAMVSHLQPNSVEKYLVHMLAPIYRITEDDTIRDTHLDELKTLAIELQDLIQSKVGTTKFSSVYNTIRQNALSVRRERKTQRAIQTTSNPGAAFKRKQQRNLAKKDSRKRKNSSFAQGRGRTKRLREE